MARSVSLDDFGRMAGDLVRAVAADGDTVVVTQEDQPVAVLASHKSVLSMASLVDLPRWEEWLRDMKDAMPDAARRAPPE
jgi:prevent-host-death family protein